MQAGCYALGAAVVCGVGLGLIPSFGAAKQLIPTGKIYFPRKEYKVLYRQNRKLFSGLNRQAAPKAASDLAGQEK